jgi:hypothetical protein
LVTLVELKYEETEEIREANQVKKEANRPVATTATIALLSPSILSRMALTFAYSSTVIGWRAGSADSNGLDIREQDIYI